MALTKVNSILVDGAINTTAAGNVGIGTASPTEKVTVAGAVIATSGASSITRDATIIDYSSGSRFIAGRAGGNFGNWQALVAGSSGVTLRYKIDYDSLTQWFAADGTTERMRIASNGRVSVNSPSFTDGMVNIKCATSTSGMAIGILNNGDNAVNWYNASNTYVSSIVVNSGTVAYNTSSDYRLKENVTPMASALATVEQLNPVTWNWKADGKNGQGFIAHELQEVVPDAVTGKKDAVDEEGNPKYQGIDTSFLVATLTAAIQEQQAIITDLTTRLEALEANK